MSLTTLKGIFSLDEETMSENWQKKSWKIGWQSIYPFWQKNIENGTCFEFMEQPDLFTFREALDAMKFKSIIIYSNLAWNNWVSHTHDVWSIRIFIFRRKLSHEK